MCLNGILHLAGIKTLLTVCFCRQRHAGENPAVAGYEADYTGAGEVVYIAYV